MNDMNGENEMERLMKKKEIRKIKCKRVAIFSIKKIIKQNRIGYLR